MGCGCGILSLGAQILGASHVVGFEIDSDALEIQSRNCNEMEVFVEAVQCDILRYLPGILFMCLLSCKHTYAYLSFIKIDTFFYIIILQENLKDILIQ